MKYRMKIVYRGNFCSPVLDRDKMIKSSVYNRELSFAPFCKTKGIFKCEREVVNIKIKKK